ncbi:hypothetical protein [Streptomyces sp. KN37]|uniref:hypothetical protein n=1 Tax=Streptomyces sp. KN37 TaxID=3090667 RepID=UPI002A757607|nr:hypothetical protein [Streptomyces sp. KN37]WPO76521.1 hypothetical protein R9806_38320 [Streptomyces sp. KN37]
MSRGQSDKPLECRAGHAMSTEAGIDVQQELEDRIHEFRTSAPPMPVVVLHAEDDAADGDVFAQLGLIARQLCTPGSDQSALVLARKQPDKGKGTGTEKEREGRTDAYTQAQATFGGRMLAREGFTMQDLLAYDVPNGTPQMGEQAEPICKRKDVPTVIYFAGRVEDLRSLRSELGEEKGCKEDMTILTGDDLSKARFPPDKERVGPNVTLYHVTLAKMSGPGGTDFCADAQKAFPESFPGRIGPDSPRLASGQAALSHDATKALHTAAGKAPRNRAATWVNLAQRQREVAGHGHHRRHQGPAVRGTRGAQHRAGGGPARGGRRHVPLPGGVQPQGGRHRTAHGGEVPDPMTGGTPARTPTSPSPW